jgi:hypothetical protein
MTVATTSDVAARIGRPLVTQEIAKVTALLQDAEVEIRRVSPDRITDPSWKDAVVSVECSMVIRAARLPDALNSVVPALEGVGYESAPLTQGAVYLRRSERRTLGLPNVGSVATTPDPCTVLGHEEGWPSMDGWPWAEGH